MARRRRIVPDNSIIVPAFFKETIQYQGNDFPLSRRASEIVDAIRRRDVDAIAPDHLAFEFLKVAFRKTGDSVTIEDASMQVYGFVQLWAQCIRSESMTDLTERAWQLCTEDGISPPDSLYLACAMVNDAELWVAKMDEDRFAERAREVYSNVHVLTEGAFRGT